MGWLVTIFTGTAGRIIGWILAAVIGAGAVIGLYVLVTKNAAENQSLKDRNVQLEQLIKNQEDFARKTKELESENQKLRESLETSVKEIQEKNQKLDNFLDKVEQDKGGKAASETLKETIRQLKRNR